MQPRGRTLKSRTGTQAEAGHPQQLQHLEKGGDAQNSRDEVQDAAPVPVPPASSLPATEPASRRDPRPEEEAEEHGRGQVVRLRVGRLLDPPLRQSQLGQDGSEPHGAWADIWTAGR